MDSWSTRWLYWCCSIATYLSYETDCKRSSIEVNVVFLVTIFPFFFFSRMFSFFFLSSFFCRVENHLKRSPHWYKMYTFSVKYATRFIREQAKKAIFTNLKLQKTRIILRAILRSSCVNCSSSVHCVGGGSISRSIACCKYSKCLYKKKR